MPRRKKKAEDESRTTCGYYHISAVARMYNIHPQTLRLYEREGLLKPSRSEGNTRLYTGEDLKRLELILNLIRDLGVNLAGVEVILNMREKMKQIENQVNELLDYIKQEFFKGREEEFEARRRSLVHVKMTKPMPVEKPGDEPNPKK
ncbi:MAG: HspR, transcriptional repressor of DnaK operon [Candidatus Saccharicenans subterraneus]|uniref:HspR, transcriptional repressor of DnaK operon n=1 Tax=Candidatus Saccharicenans subterraneus TaxID=2508984 RepID=A0A3E2BJV5_9BACT|nr:MAG: HspR, transcriptional repressor of DnaK operon [Candidatus Saccharicenans subterraneum]